MCFFIKSSISLIFFAFELHFSSVFESEFYCRVVSSFYSSTGYDCLNVLPNVMELTEELNEPRIDERVKGLFT